MLTYRFLVAGVALALIAGLGTSQAAVSDNFSKLQFNLYPVPCPANNLVLKDLKGAPVDLAAFRNKVVILNFWKIDCPPCSREKPILERIYRKYASKGLAIVSVNLFDDPGQQRIYVQNSGYSFTFAFDPDRLFSIRPQTMTSGATTNFVVNSRAEAIYEIPAVPTTYLIDRQGQVVGNSVGMVNWEKDQLAELLESLLAAPQTLASDQESGWFAGQAGQGSGASGPVARPTAPPVRVPQAPTDISAPSPEPAPRLPFQGAGPTQQPSVVAPGGPRAAPSEGVDGARQHLVEPAPPKPTGQVKRSATKPTTQPDKPPQHKLRGAAGGTAHKPGARSLSQGGAGAGPESGSPGSAATTQTGAPGGTGSLPPLPPANLYTRPIPGGTTPARSLVPDTDGTVQARIPGPGTGGNPFAGGGPEAVQGLPAAQPMGSANPISGFIMDSFGHTSRPTPIAPPGGQPPPIQRPQTAADQGVPASGILGQLTQDVQNLGAGIKDVFQRFVPGPPRQ